MIPDKPQHQSLPHTDKSDQNDVKGTILLLVDAFHRDRALLDYGISFAQSMNANLELFDVQVTARSLPDVGRKAGTEDRNESVILRQAQDRMKEICKVAKVEWPHTDYRLIKDVMYGKVPGKVNYWLDAVESLEPRAVVMRVRSSKINLLNEIIGTEETKLAERANCPVMLVPDNISKFKGFQRVAYLLDRDKSLDEAGKEVNFLLKILQKPAGICKVYYLTEATGQARELEAETVRSRLSRVRKDQDSHVKVVDFSTYTPGDAPDELVRMPVNQLVAFSQRKASLLERLVHKDHTKRLILNADIPVLVF